MVFGFCNYFLYLDERGRWFGETGLVIMKVSSKMTVFLERLVTLEFETP